MTLKLLVNIAWVVYRLQSFISKKSIFSEKLTFLLVFSKLPYLGLRESTRGLKETSAHFTSDCLCCLWSEVIIGLYFFKKEGGATIMVNGDIYRSMITNCFLYHLSVILMATIFNFTITVQLATHLVSQSIYYLKCLTAVWVVKMVMSIRRQETVMWHCWTIICEVHLQKNIIPSNQIQFSIWRPTFVMSLPRCDLIH